MRTRGGLNDPRRDRVSRARSHPWERALGRGRFRLLPRPGPPQIARSAITGISGRQPRLAGAGYSGSDGVAMRLFERHTCDTGYRPRNKQAVLHRQAQVAVPAGLLRGDDIDALVEAVAPADIPGWFTPDVAVLELAMSALDGASVPGSEPLPYEGGVARAVTARRGNDHSSAAPGGAAALAHGEPNALLVAAPSNFPDSWPNARLRSTSERGSSPATARRTSSPTTDISMCSTSCRS